VNEIEKLLTVQEHDVRIRNMERELKDLPARKKQDKSKLDQHDKAVAEAKDKLKAAQAGIKTIEVEAMARREKITKLRQQQMELKTNKEFKTMDEEIKLVEGEIKGLEDKELVHMEELEKARALVAERENILKEQGILIQKDLAVWDERAAGINEQLAEIKAKREAAAKDVKAEWLGRYKRVFAGKDRAVVPLEEGVCGGCHMKLPPAIFHAARRHDSITTCAYCGRLLY
jgi:uncharacterized protein